MVYEALKFVLLVASRAPPPASSSRFPPPPRILARFAPCRVYYPTIFSSRVRIFPPSPLGIPMLRFSAPLRPAAPLARPARDPY